MFRALRHRNYLLFFCSQLISFTGIWMQSVGQSWLVYRLTGSAVQLGAVAFCSQIPTFLLVSFGGVAADRISRRKIITITQSLCMCLAGLLAFLTLTDRVAIWHLYCIAICFGIVSSFDLPARQSFIVQLVGSEDLPNAISLNSSVVNGARLVGPAVAGVLVAWIGEGWCFFANALGYSAVLIGLSLMRMPAETPRPSNSGIWEPLQQGFKFVISTPPIRTTLIMLGLMSFCSSPQVTLMPIFADQILHGGPHTLGLLMGVSGAGALVGALALAARRTVRGLEVAVAVTSISMGALFIAFAHSQTTWISALLMVGIGFCIMVQMASSNTLIQSMVPDDLRGRVMSFHAMMFMGVTPIGALVSGFLARQYSAPTTMLLAGGLLAIGGSIFAFNLRAFRVLSQRVLSITARENATLQQHAEACSSLHQQGQQPPP